MPTRKFSVGDIVTPTKKAPLRAVHGKSFGIVLGYVSASTGSKDSYGKEYVDIAWLKNTIPGFKKNGGGGGQMDGGYSQSNLKLVATNVGKTDFEDITGSLYHTLNAVSVIYALQALARR